MRIRKISLYHLSLPFRSSFGHARAKHTETHNVIVECCLENGLAGYGESVPRDYVTGESIDSVFRLFEKTHHAHFQKNVGSPGELIKYLSSGWCEWNESENNGGSQAARCALELALLDAYGKFFNMSAGDLIDGFAGEKAPGKSPAVSGVIGAGGSLKQRFLARAMRFYGLPGVKLKVGSDKEDVLKSVKGVRRALGKKYGLRIDANGAWSYSEAVDILGALGPLNLNAVEEPLKKEDKHRLAELKQRVRQKIILDESVCSKEDLEWAIKEKCTDGVNIRISKCGGLIPALEMAAEVRQHRLILQLGAHVGETGILDAAARHFLRFFPGVDFLETSYGGFLLKHSLVKEKFGFGRGGKLKGKMHATGLGIHVDRELLENYTKRYFEVSPL